MAQKKFHISPELGPRPCDANIQECRMGVHFEDAAEAQKFWEDNLESLHGQVAKLGTKSKNNAKLGFSEELYSFNERFLESEFPIDNDELIAYAAGSQRNYDVVSQSIEDRLEETREYKENIDRLNPSVNPGACDERIFQQVLREFNSYRNTTAELVEAQLASPYHTSPVREIDVDTMGKLKRTTKFEHNTADWLRARTTSMGGSDVGILATMDFGEPSAFDQVKYEKLVLEKSQPVNEDKIEKEANTKNTKRSGALYRGTVWEERIRDDFAKDYADSYEVLATDDQFQNPDRKFQQVNLDGILKDKQTGDMGILEIKTAVDDRKWRDGIPGNYRAQTLYYLNATGFEYANVRVLIGDVEYRDYTLRKDDEVAPGCGVNMEQYITSRVEPWFRDMKDTARQKAGM